MVLVVWGMHKEVRGMDAGSLTESNHCQSGALSAVHGAESHFAFSTGSVTGSLSPPPLFPFLGY